MLYPYSYRDCKRQGLRIYSYVGAKCEPMAVIGDVPLGGFTLYRTVYPKESSSFCTPWYENKQGCIQQRQ